MNKTLLPAAAICALFFSCANHKNRVIAASEPAFRTTALDSAYSTIRPAIQRFAIDNRKATTVKAARGTEVLIPAGCLETSDGEKVQDVQLEIVEAFSLRDFVTSGLTTLSGDRLLVSNGMLYINARSGSEVLRLARGMSLTVSMPTMTNYRGFQLFSGKGGDWIVDSAMTASDYAIPLPLDLLYPYGNDVFTTEIRETDGKVEEHYYLDTAILNVTAHKYENTVIATEEFQLRFGFLWAMMNSMSYFCDSDYFYEKGEYWRQSHFNYDIWRVYFDHPTRSFRASDSIAKRLYADYIEANRDKIADFCERVNAYRKANYSDTSTYFDFRTKSLDESLREPLKYFPRGDKELEIVDNHGVDPSAPDAFAQLQAKGIDIGEINRIMTYNFKRASKLAELRRAKEAIASQKAVATLYESTVFSVNRMGWINCDRFYDDPAAGKAAIVVSNSSGRQLDYIDCSLVVPGINARLTAYPAGADRWSFTKKDGRYTRLPIGRKAVITGVALQHDSLFFASKKITITDSLLVDLPMRYIARGELQDSLSAALER